LKTDILKRVDPEKFKGSRSCP